MSDKSLIISIVAVGVTLGGMILATDDGARIDALEAKLDTRIDALEAKLDTRIDALEAKLDALDAKVDDIRVYIAAKHGEPVSFMPSPTGSRQFWLIKAVDPKTGGTTRVGTLGVQGEAERRAVLKMDNGEFVRQWTHLGETDTLRRARAIITLALSE